MTAAEYVAYQLKSIGIDRVYGIPGEENLFLLDAIKNSGLEFITTSHESGAGFMAAAEGRIHGVPGVVCTTLGPGATNLATALAYATNGGFPLIAITAEKPHDSTIYGSFQVVDTFSALRPLCKDAVKVTDIKQIPSAVRKVIDSIADGRLGAVLLEIPEDIYHQSIPSEDTIYPTQKSVVLSEPKIQMDIARRLLESKKTFLVLGEKANNPNVSGALHELLRDFPMKFFTTPQGIGTLSVDHPGFSGVLYKTESLREHQLLGSADLIVLVGYDTYEKPPFKGISNRKIVSINSTHIEPNDALYPSVEILGDISSNLRGIRTALTKGMSSSTKKVWMNNYETKEPEGHLLESQLQDLQGIKVGKGGLKNVSHQGISPITIVEALNTNVGSSDRISLDNGLFKYYFAKYFKAQFPKQLLLDNSLATMGAGIPVAIASAISDKKIRRNIAITGDGGFNMSLGELQTAADQKLNLLVLVLDDNGLGMIKWKQKHHGLDEYATTISSPSVPQLAASYGGQGYIVENEQELGPVLSYAFRMHGLRIVSISIDYSNADQEI